MTTRLEGSKRSVVLEVDGLQWATEKNVVEAVLGRRPGVTGVEANPVAQTATVTFDPARTTVENLAGWVRDCGYHCRGESVPDHVCPPAGPVTGTPGAGAGRPGRLARLLPPRGADMILPVTSARARWGFNGARGSTCR